MSLDAFLFGFITACLLMLVIFLFLSRNEGNRSESISAEELMKEQLQMQQIQNMLSEQKLLEKRQQVEFLQLQREAHDSAVTLSNRKQFGSVQ